VDYTGKDIAGGRSWTTPAIPTRAPEAEWRKQPIHSDYDAKLAVAYNVVQI
jgi:hypothetical protein